MATYLHALVEDLTSAALAEVLDRVLVIIDVDVRGEGATRIGVEEDFADVFEHRTLVFQIVTVRVLGILVVTVLMFDRQQPTKCPSPGLSTSFAFGGQGGQLCREKSGSARWCKASKAYENESSAPCSRASWARESNSWPRHWLREPR